MDCSKAWLLMMKHFDKDIQVKQDQQLMEHLKLCSACSNEHNALKTAFAQMREFRVEAPADMERQVMQKLKKTQKEGRLYLPFVIAPLIILLALSVLGFHLIFSYGPFHFMDQCFRLLTLTYRTFSAAIALIERLVNTFYFRHAIITLMIVCIVCAGQYIVRNCRKAKTGFNGG